MVDSRQKGARAELQARDLLRKHTGLKWERVPGSGALHEKHGLKGDLYIPGEHNLFCVEVKHYKDDQISTKLLTGTSPTFIGWWEQTVREADQVGKIPMLLFKHDRSKWFMASELVAGSERSLVYSFSREDGMYTSVVIQLLEEALEILKLKWTK